MSSSEVNCSICNSKIYDDDKTCRVGPRGLKTLIEKSIGRSDGNHEKWTGLNELITHESCRATYINVHSIAAAKKRRFSVDQPESSESTKFNFKELCILCGEPCSAKLESKKPSNRRRKIHLVTSESNFKNKILEACNSCSEPISAEMISRFSEVEDLSSVEAKYHHNCNVIFIRKLTASQPAVNPGNSRYVEQFEKLFNFLEETEDPQWTLDEIIEFMGSPTRQYVREILTRKYENNIHFSSGGRNRTIVTITSFKKDIFLDYFKNSIPAESDAEKKANILKLAAKYLRDDIRSIGIDNEYYPASNEFFDDGNILGVLPDSLHSFLSSIILSKKKDVKTCEKKVTAIGHAIMCATRPKSFLSPLQLATSLYIHSKYQSKLLINILHRLGLCASYDMTLLYEESAMMSSLPLIQPTANSFVQFIYDNADYDVNTIDGKNTFHYTAGIETITPDNSVGINLSIKRLKKLPPASDVANKFKVQIYDYVVPETRGLQQIKIKDIRTLRTLESNHTYLSPGEVLWTAGHLLKIPEHPGWSGFMELRTNSAVFNVSEIKYLSFIYLKATDNSAIFSAMMYGINEAKKIGQKNVFFTFDQQLYIKAREISADVQHKLVKCDENMDHVFIRLGGFHLIMSFLNCIGKIVDGSGLKEVWSTIYAEKSTEKMLSGKNYSRAVRAHYYTQAALLLIIMQECGFHDMDLLNQLLDIDSNTTRLQKTSHEQTILQKLENDSTVIKFVEAVRLHMQVVAEKGKTATLWIQYIKMVSLFRSFIQAERSGNFQLHISTIIEMIPFFHACSHFNYAKCAHLYVQDNLDLEAKMDSPEEF